MKNILSNENANDTNEAIANNVNIETLLKRGNIALEDGEWNRAEEFFESVLNVDAECAEAYLGLAFKELGVASFDEIYKKYGVDSVSELPCCLSAYDKLLQRVNVFKNEVVVSCVVENYLTAQDILSRLNFDFSYTGVSAELIKCKQNSMSIICGNKKLERAKKINSQYQEKIQKILSDIQSEFDDKIQAASQHEEHAVENIFIEFKSYVNKTVEALRDEAVKKREEDYQNALQLFNKRKFKAAKKFFAPNKLGNYLDSAEHYKKCCKKTKGKIVRRVVAVIVLAVLAVSGVFGYSHLNENVLQPLNAYNEAVETLNRGEYGMAAEKFLELGSYKDSQELYQRAHYNNAVDFYNDDKYEKAIEFFEKCKTYKDSEELIKASWYYYAQSDWEQDNFSKAAVFYAKAGDYKNAEELNKFMWEKVGKGKVIACGDFHAAAVKENGKVVATKLNNGYEDRGQCDVDDWEDIIAVDVGYGYTVGLREDGTVVATTIYAQDVKNWTGVKQIAAGNYFTYALKYDGTVITTDSFDDYSDWNDIIAIAAEDLYVLGLKSDGTVISKGLDEQDQLKIEEWEDIVSIYAKDDCSLGIKSDGTVVAAGCSDRESEELKKWDNIVQVAGDGLEIFGLKNDGTLVSTKSSASLFENIVAIDGRMCLKTDGTVATLGLDLDDSNVENWKNIKTP